MEQIKKSRKEIKKRRTSILRFTDVRYEIACSFVNHGLHGGVAVLIDGKRGFHIRMSQCNREQLRVYVCAHHVGRIGMTKVVEPHAREFARFKSMH